jgi:arginine decarboxylase
MTSETLAVPQNYGIARWGSGYFGINGRGHVSVTPRRRETATIDLHELATDMRREGLAWPVLVRFIDILHDRVSTLCESFSVAMEEHGYSGRYTAVYPVKVNQQRAVIEEILRAGDECTGLEAGSKPELMAVLALSRPAGTIICNGYKDREYIRLALIGRQIGHRVIIVVEKPSELDLVLKESAALDIEPEIGVRVRLAASAAGKWQNSGGEKAKFGLSASEVLRLVARLRGADRLHCLKLLHSHIGSQIPNLRDIRRGLGETARYFAELRLLGAPLSIVDVGGGLGVDYDGTGTRNDCSINYSPESYAREVIKALTRVCHDHDLPHPDVISESGRALTAHHAVLIANVIEREPPAVADVIPAIAGDAPEVLRMLALEQARAAGAPPQEVYQEARLSLEEARELFEQGALNLSEWALAEQIYMSVVRELAPRLSGHRRRDRELLDLINEQLADKVFVNFSLFQSMPDVWAIDQVFPVVPLHRLNEEPTRSAVVHDLTCDSDGCITEYVDQDGIERSLPLHEPVADEDYLLGIFMVGAYQEILGDMHNLFGDTDAVNVELLPDGAYRLTQPEKGDSVDELLGYVHFDIDRMLATYREKLNHSGLPERKTDAFYEELKAGIFGYTYLED